MITATISKSSLPASSKEEKKIERKPDDKIDKWIKMLEDAFIKERVTPAVAFKSADSNRDGSIILNNQIQIKREIELSRNGTYLNNKFGISNFSSLID